MANSSIRRASGSRPRTTTTSRSGTRAPALRPSGNTGQKIQVQRSGVSPKITPAVRQKNGSYRLVRNQAEARTAIRLAHAKYGSPITRANALASLNSTSGVRDARSITSKGNSVFLLRKGRVTGRVRAVAGFTAVRNGSRVVSLRGAGREVRMQNRGHNIRRRGRTLRDSRGHFAGSTKA